MRQRLFSLLLSVIFVTAFTPASFSMLEDNVIWQVKPREGSYMKYFGKRVIDVNRADSDRLVPQEFGWQGNQVIFIFHLTSRQLQSPQFEFVFEIVSKDYDVDELVELDIYAGTNINNLKTISQKIKVDHSGLYRINIPTTTFYLGSQNFVKIYGPNVRPIGYGENPPNCRFGSFKLVIPGEGSKQEIAAMTPAQIEKQKASVVSLGPQAATVPSPNASVPAQVETPLASRTSEMPAPAPSETEQKT